MTELNPNDRRLLDLLSANAREAVSALARKLNLARSTVQERIARLEQRGVISGYTIRLGREAAERQIGAHVMLSIDPKQSDRIVAELKRMPEIRSLSAVSGAYDLIAIVAAETTKRIDEVLDAIGKIPGIARTTSSIVLTTKFER